MKIVSHNDQTCIFNHLRHTYAVQETGQGLQSVTTFIKQWFPNFDAEFVSNRIADRRADGATAEELQAEWAEKGRIARLIGNAIHGYAELLAQGTKCTFSFNGDLETRMKIHRMIPNLENACEKLLCRYQTIGAEQIIFSQVLGLAGQVDLLMQSRDSQTILIVDWKTNQLLQRENSFQAGLGPLEHLDDANLNHYALQLSAYQYILEQERYFPEAEYQRLIIHIKEDRAEPYRMPYLKDEIESMLI